MRARRVTRLGRQRWPSRHRRPSRWALPDQLPLGLALSEGSGLYGERGSIDVLAWHPATRTLLVIEVKSVIVSTEETLRRVDVKVRLAPRIGAARFGSRPATVAKLLVVGDSSTNRRRAVRLEDAGAFVSMPKHEVRAWLQRPVGTLASIMFLTPRVSSPGGSRRIRRSKDQTAAH